MSNNVIQLSDSKLVVNTVEEIINEMRASAAITDISESSGTYTLTTKTKNFVSKGYVYETKDLVNGDYVTLTGTLAGTYEISNVTATSFDIITTAGQAIVELGTYTADRPYYYPGTPIAVNTERINDKQDNNLKYPFIWLWEPTPEVVDPGGEVYSRANLHLVFLDNYNESTEQSTEDHYDNVIESVDKYWRDFYRACLVKDGILIEDVSQNTFDKVCHVKFGVVAISQGHRSLVINENVSGVEIDNFELPIIHSETCDKTVPY